MTTTIHTASGRSKTLPENLNLERVAGLDEEGRIVVDDHDAQNPTATGITYTDWSGEKRTDPPFMFGLTLCCNASDKGTEDGICCRGCYGTEPNADAGNYLHKAEDGSFPGLDPVVRVEGAPNA